LHELLELGKRRVEYCSDNATFRQWPGWQVIETPHGQLTGACVEGSGTLYIGMEIHCPEPRKFVETVGGLPNPDLQTFLRLHGAGRVRAWVNGRFWAEETVSEGKPGYVADIDFEAGANLVLLAWDPGRADATLKLAFENKDRQPEITFAFV
jgi:hypothetical protein